MGPRKLRARRWFHEYTKPNYWNDRTPLWLGMPRLVNLYLDLNDNKIRKFLKMQSGKILDLGCGDGRFLGYADLGVDFSKGMLRRAKRKGKCLVRASVLHLPFRDKIFNVAFMVDVSLHIRPTKRKEAYNEAKRVAKRMYDFLAEHRTFLPHMRSFLRGERSSRFREAFAICLALLISFPLDRIRKLVISHEDLAC